LDNKKLQRIQRQQQVVEAKWSKARVCGLSLAGIAGSNTVEGMYVCVVWCVLYSKRQKAKCRIIRKRNKYG
jgi:hypothetical protein